MSNEPLPLPLSVPIHTFVKNDIPVIELRRCVSDHTLIKAIITAAVYGHPLVIQPSFTNKPFALASLVQKGILFYDNEKEEYFFNI